MSSITEGMVCLLQFPGITQGLLIWIALFELVIPRFSGPLLTALIFLCHQHEII